MGVAEATCRTLVALALLQLAAGQGRCTNPNRRAGECVSIYECPSLREVVRHNPLTDSEHRFLLMSQCNNGVGRAPLVCCTADADFLQARDPTSTTTTTMTPTRPVWSNRPTPSVGGERGGGGAGGGGGVGGALPSPPDCGRLSFVDKIYNGNETALDEYPWMVLLGYANRNGQRSFSCGGSLINQRYILTAAHCVKGAIEQEIGPLSVVRLGEYDLSTEVDCINGDCNHRVVELPAEQVIPHPEYDPRSASRSHDIALIRLSRDVDYTDFIRPVCLPTPQRRSPLEVGELLRVAGWGRTLESRQSNRKQHLSVPIEEHGACARKFATRNVELGERQICAGGEFAKDSCDGDSGGPLMRQTGTPRRWHLEGIVSFGNRCGLEGWPGIYTQVVSYADWISQTVRP